MKRNIIIALITLFCGLNTVDAQLKFFKGDYVDAVAYAKEVNKPIFIDFYANWCVPCKQMEKYSFTDREFSRLMNENFIVVKVDVEQFAGMDVAERFRITKYPTLVIADPRGREKGRIVGFRTKDELLKFARPFAR